MPDMIKDGVGSGALAKVDRKNRLRTYSVVEDEATYINRVDKQMYSGAGDPVKATTGGNFIVYLKNISSIKDLVVVTLKHRCIDDSGTMVVYLGVTGAPDGVLTQLNPGNRNAGSNNEADCLFYQSPEITGLSGGYKIGSVFGKDGEEFEYGRPCSGWILPPNGTLAIKADNNTATHYGGLAFYFRDIGV